MYSIYVHYKSGRLVSNPKALDYELGENWIVLHFPDESRLVYTLYDVVDITIQKAEDVPE